MYELTSKGTFEMENYQELAPFSSFLPGIAGVNGIPMWVFYVNRGQGIASFGIGDKNHAMMEFMPADKSYQHVPQQGFRTFLKVIEEDGKVTFLEPFSAQSSIGSSIHEKMTISENVLELEYVHADIGLKLNVEYFILPEEAFAGLVRHVTVTNLTDKKREIEILDGLPALFPCGVPNGAYKELGNTIKSWFDVVYVDEKIPFYRLRGSIEDSSEVREIHQGNFYVSFSRSQQHGDQMIKPIVDRDIIFGTDTSLRVPRLFLQQSVHELLQQPQQSTNKVSAGFSAGAVKLAPRETFEFYTVIGHAKNEEIVKSSVKDILSISMLEEKKERARTITHAITNKIKTRTGMPLFDAYAQQSFLDNGLRGGFPHVFENGKQKKIYYLFSRKHGDLERDYNFFSISPTYYSQGNGNYRDINQNRRCDVFFEPKVENFNVQQFMNLIQLDGYNPLSVKGVRFQLMDAFSHESYVQDETSKELLSHFFKNSFTPGELKHFVDEEGLELTTSFEQFLTDVLLASSEEQQAEFGEGYWMDHWTYNLDLIDSYLSIYPDKEQPFFLQKEYKFFESPVRVKTRKEKYVERNGKVRQYDAVEKIKRKLEKARANDGVLWIKGQYGDGETYYTSLYSKLFILGLVKVSTMAPFGLGIEMDGDKPGWNDSLNGLPGMIGASTSELFELKRLLDLLFHVNVSGTEKISLPIEVDTFLRQAIEEVQLVDCHSEESEQRYWNSISTLRENYREAIYHGISGEEVVYSLDEVKDYVTKLLGRVEQGIKRVESYRDPLIPTYFYFEPKVEIGEEFDLSSMEWKPTAVTPFLEGVVKQLKTTDDQARAKELYDIVKASNIYDEKLQMYKTSMSIAEEPLELGRAKSFTPGWLENESIFLHMEYKYLLATLKAGLIDEFFEDMKTALIPFLDPAVYGRSPLENSSFIASSANPNPALHGRGFVSRLSGSTIEFMNMWFVMMVGEKPFFVQNGELVCHLSPTLPNWLFDENGEVTFTFLGHTEVTYVNKNKGNTYGGDGVSPISMELELIDGTKKKVEDSKVVGELAVSIRKGKVQKIAVELK
ncbi:hypothetical protein BC6307_00500 [Sutcliffiella cohnii]|uniref:Cellobiose phosphorylase n=1 Tax=Sutcliffiella cohnii TaxID=33932 RepID=A0A223KK49_9BACI|nr:hypothetical protein [Sutcliffiella cohnii]AST89861.1 hypothetical protein BC6307_00500 [Sutcliffiella cohnii]